VIGYVLIQIFAIDLHWLPVQGFRSITRVSGRFSSASSCRLSRCHSSMSH